MQDGPLIRACRALTVAHDLPAARLDLAQQFAVNERNRKGTNHA